MDVVEDPFATRQAIAKVLSLGSPTTDAPLRTLRRHVALSDGVSLPLRNTSGQLLGRLHVYSVLSADAARLFRLGHRDAAVRIAGRAQQLERSRAGRRVVRAIERTASRVPIDTAGGHRTDHEVQLFRAYVEMRGTASWEALEQQTLWRAWVSEPQSWLAFDADAAVREAVHELAARVQQARADEPVLTRLTTSNAVTRRVGIVARLDPLAAELETVDGSRFIVPRRDLEREGLAVIGQAVTSVREEVPGGPVVDFYAAAAQLAVEPDHDELDPFAPSTAPVELGAADSIWLERVIASEPTTVPIAPLAIGGT
jgi:hypothetical protein